MVIGAPPPAPPVCSRCNEIVHGRHWLSRGTLLCSECGDAAKTRAEADLEGPFVNDRSSAGSPDGKGV